MLDSAPTAYLGPLRTLALARDCACMTTGEYAVLVVLVLRADNETGICDPAVSTIAVGAKMSDRGTRIAIDALQGAGWVRVVRRKIPGSKENDTHVYTLQAPRHGVVECPRCAVVSAARAALTTRRSARTAERAAQSDGHVRKSVPVGAEVSAENLLSALPETTQIPEGIRIPPYPPSGGNIPGGTSTTPVGNVAPPAPASEPSTPSDAGPGEQVAGVVAVPPITDAAPGERESTKRSERGPDATMKRGPRAPRAAKALAGPMPDGWAPSPAHFAKGLEFELDEAAVRLEAELFISWTARDKKSYIDWEAAFRNHLIGAVKRARDRKAEADAKEAARSGPPLPADRIPEAEILQAYADGIIAAVGGTFVCESKHIKSLRAMFKGHARDPQGRIIGPTETLTWIRATAKAYRLAVVGDQPKFQAGYNPPACVNWLNSLRPTVRGTTSGASGGIASDTTRFDPEKVAAAEAARAKSLRERIAAQDAKASGNINNLDEWTVP